MKKLLYILTINFLFFFNAFSQSDCNNPLALTPGTQQCGTNSYAGSFDDGGGNPVNPCSSWYNDGEYWFSYTANASGDALQLDVSSLSDTYSGIYVLDDCPANSPNCIASHDNSSSTANYSVTTPALNPGQTYYIVIANWSSPYQTDFCLDATEITIVPTCNDGIQNQGETGIDCGGPCPPCGIGTDCANANVITSLPYNISTTTCGAGNFYSSTDACLSSYMNGEDYVFEYTPSVNEQVNLTLTGTDTWTGVFILDGCPDQAGTNCIGSGTNSAGNPTLNCVALTAGQTYYIVVSTYPLPDCTAFTLDMTATASTAPTTINACTGTFYDSGGAAGNYSPCESYVVTYCPSTPGMIIQLDFTTWDVEPGTNDDVLSVYDGTSTTDPLVYNADGLNSALGTVQASQSNASGCLTFEWNSDADATTGTGWVANINCVYPCQLVQAVWGGSNPADNANYIDICQGDAITFNASGSYPQNNTNYFQSDPTSTFTWVFGDGTQQSGLGLTSVTHTYPNEGGYNVDLIITDVNGCESTNSIDIRVRVSTTPIFAGTVSSVDSLCLGQCANLTGVATPVTFNMPTGQVLADTTFLPDGSGVTYSTSLTFTNFTPGQTVTSLSDIVDICMEIEHSYIGDLDAVIECPNGQQVTLFDGDILTNGTSSGAWLGVPLGGSLHADYDNTPLTDPTVNLPGTPWTYCFDMSAPTMLTDVGTPFDASIPAGTYLSEQSFAGLIGCPLNGTWTIHITDDIGADNGWIYSWGINFDPTIYPPLWSFTPTIVSETWTGNGVSPGNPTTACPTAIGNQTYTYSVTDDFGCTYDTTLTIVVSGVTVTMASTNPTCGLCNGAASVSGATGGTTPYSYLWSNGATTQNLTNLCSGTYDVTVTDAGGCQGYGSVTISSPPAMTLALTPATATCGNANGQINVAVTGGTSPYDIDWAPGGVANNQTSPYDITGLLPGTYSITVTDNNGCTVTGTTTVADGGNVIALISPVANQCLLSNSFTFDASGSTTISSPAYSWDFGDGNTGTGVSVTHTYTTAGTYTVQLTITDGSCSDITTISVTVFPQPTTTFNITNVSCNGGSDGSVQSIPATGSSPYSYDWSPNGFTGDGTSTYSGLPAGTYTVTVTDANLCTVVGTATVTEPLPLDLTATRTNVLCSGECTGTASVVVNSGGTPTYTYNWGAGTTPTNSTTGGLCAGTYTVTVTDVNGCTATASVTITEPPTPLSLTISGNNVTCNGACDGDATVVASGGTAGYTYAWSGGAGTASTASSLCAGTYTVTVTDANNCTATASITLTEPALLTVTVTGSNITCNGACDGTVAANPSGGTTPYSYSWDNGAGTASSASGLCAGTYTVTITDANSCTATGSFTVTENPAVTASVTGTNVTCNGACDGTATVTAGGGTGTYTYLWNDPAPAQTTATATGLCAGTFTVTVTDSDGCTATSSITITENPAVTATLSGSTNVSCNGACDGTATVTAGGGDGTYTYLWNDPAPAQTTATATGLCAGTFTVTVTDGNSCTSTANITITENPAVTSSVTGTNLTCNGACDGTATVTAGGGTGTYTYQWDDPGTQTTATASGLCAGTFNVTVTDGNSCTSTANITITENPAVTSSVTGTNVTCNGACDGTVTVTAGGGTGTYTYQWDDPGTQTTAAITGLCAGTFNVTVTDGNGCTATSSITITENPAVTATLSGSTNVSCNGVCDGTATVTAGGGDGTYTYLWNDPGAQTTAAATGLCAGTFTVTVTDGSGCTATTTAIITENPALTVSLTGTVDVTCNGDCDGTATITASGGTGTYTYLWNDPGAQTTTTATGLCAGTFTVTVTDGNSCTATVSAVINENPAVTASATGTDATCNATCDGTATVTAGGGDGTYIYQWDDPTFQTTAAATGLCAGTYNVTVTDGNGCTAIISQTINEPAAIALTPSSVDATCGNSDGQASISVSGGTTPYSYDWSPNGFTGDGTNTYSNLPAGAYSVTVTDANSCTATTTINVNDAGSPTATISGSTDVTCNGDCDGDATVNAVGGAGSYTYQWDDPGSQTTATATGLCAGTFNVTVTDGLGCIATASVTINENPPLIATITGSTNVSCNGACDGTATLSVSGGTGTYTYLWDDPSSQTTASVTGLCAGTYNVTVSDGNSCTATANVTITENPVVTATISGSTNVTCNGDCDGTAIVSAGGGDGTYSYQWDDPGLQTTASVTGLCAGTYNVTVSDGNSCTATANVTITENPVVTATISGSTNVTCNGDCDGTAIVSAGGGDGTYSYQWDDPGSQTTATATGLCAGTFNVTVTDGNGCTATTNVTITENPVVTAGITSSTDVTCNGGCDGSSTVTANGGDGTYTYLWNDLSSQTTATATGLCAGTYNVTVTDGNGCTAVDNVTINENPAVTAATTGIDVLCNGDCNGSATVTPGGGNGTYTYIWDDPVTQSTATATGLCAGTFNVTVTDGLGCTASATQTINENAIVTATITSSNDVTISGLCDGDATVSGGGGDGTYTYLWSDISSQTTVTATGLCAGTYTVTVTDGNGCTAIATVTINEPNALIVVSTTVNASCNGSCDGSAMVNVTGGVLPYTFIWDDPLSQTDSVATNLCAGTYTVTITDFNGAQNITSVTITEPTILASSITDSSDVSCNGLCDGYATVAATGGTVLGSYSYLWNDAGSQTTQTASGLCAGTYTVTVTDDNACTSLSTITINEPPLLTASITLNNDVSCNGQCDGLSTVTAGGGTPSYTYLWDDPSSQTTQTATNLCAGTFNVTITDANSCTVVVGTTINEPPILTATTTVTDAHCGLSDGDATVTATGGTGTGTYSYLWNDALSQTTTTATNLSTGVYSVTVTDGNGCTVVVTANVGDLSGVTATISGQTDVSCNGLCDGDAIVNGTGGNPPYTYLWDDPAAQTTATATGLCAGTFNVTVTDFDGCFSVASVTVTEPSLLASTILSSTDVSCNGGNDGSATVTATGGTPAYTYVWDGGASPLLATDTGLIAGTYNVTVTDGNGCTATTTVTITEPAPITLVLTGVDENCGQGNGWATVTATGGTVTTDYSYSWDGGTNPTTDSIINLGAGTYNVTVTDDNGCTITDFQIINNILPGTATISSFTDVSCNGFCDGEATVSIGGGVPPYTYLWDDPSAQTTATATGLCQGVYNVSVTDSNNCVVSTSVTISEPLVLTNSMAVTNIICFGDCNGSLTANVSGGTTPYSYQWDDPALTINQTVNNLCSGTYHVTVTDNNGCILTDSITLTDPVQMTISLDSIVPASCGQHDGSVYITINNGNAPFTYSWSPGGYTAEDIVGVLAGTYTVTVTDFRGCTATGVYTVPDLTGPTATISNIVDVDCFGNCNGSLTVTGTGGTGIGTYTYLWDDPAAQSAQTATNLCAGIYNVTITDANGCVASANASVTEPTQLAANYFTNDVTCNSACNGYAYVVASGGISPYSYQWSDPLSQTTDTASSLCAGQYDITITDNNGCTITNNLTINEPTFISLLTTTTDVTCFGASDGTATVTATGGTVLSGYSYLWDDPSTQTTQTAIGLSDGTYCVTVTDDNGCTESICVTITTPTQLTAQITNYADVTCNGYNDGYAVVDVAGGTPTYSFVWNNSDTTQSINNIGGGNYNVLVTDVNGCTVIANVVIGEPPALTLTLNPSDETCSGYCDGFTDAIIGGGISPYNILWSDLQTTNPAINLCPGNYTATVTDANGCTISSTATISGPPLLEVINPTVVDANCGQANGSATVQINGGTGPVFTYEWQDASSSTISNTVAITGVTAGSYYFTVTDNNGCQATLSINISNLTGPNIDSIIVVDVDCYGNINGTATVYASGGDLPYTYQWDDPMNQTTQTAISLAGNTTYLIEVEDNSGCIATGTAFVYEPPQLVSAIVSVSDVLCNGGSDGSITVQVAGGTGTYSYLWNPTNQTTATATGLSSGNYVVSVTDANGCTSISSTTVGEPVPISIAETITDASCNGSCDGIISLVTSGGTQPATFNWLPPATGTNSFASNLCAGSISVIVSDANNCDTSLTYVVNEPNPIVVTTSTTPVTCNAANGTATVDNVTGGNGGYSYLWSPGNYTSASVSNLDDGTYILQVTDSLGCNEVVYIDVQNIPPPNQILFFPEDVLCNGGTDGSISTDVSGGTPPYTYLWSDGQTGFAAYNLPVGQYSVTVTDSYNCTITGTSIVGQPSPISVILDGPADTICIGQWAYLTAIGSGGTGTGTYTYFWSDSAFTDSISIQAIKPLTTSSYQVYVVDSNGCMSSPASIIVNVHPPLSIAVSTDAYICQGETQTLIATASGGSGPPYSYIWNDGNTSSINDVSPLQTTTYEVSVYDDCTTPYDSASTTVYVTQAPVLTDMPLSQSGCVPLTATFNSSASVSSGTVSYLWNFGDISSGSYNTSTDSVTTHIYDNPGVYDVSLTLTSNPAGCVTVETFPGLIVVNEIPDAEFYSTPEVASLFNSEIEFWDQSTPVTQWLWYFGDGGIATDQNPAHTYTSADTFTVWLYVTTDAGCSDSVSHDIVIREENTFYAPTAFSPASGLQNNYFYPKGVGIDPNEYLLIIYDRWGEIIYQTETYPEGTHQKNEVSGGWNGRYFNTGRYVKVGTYTWYVKFKTIYGEEREEVGAVTVIR